MHTSLPTVSVSELNALVKINLEQHFGALLVKGEISNYILASSGHSYFSLKDDKAQVKCAFFAGHQRKMSQVKLQNGQKVIALAKVSLYEPRGDYQLIVSQIQEDGIGDLYQQFIELKNRLAQEGLFDERHKQAIPKFVKHLAIITSPIGAAFHDIQTTLKRRFPLLEYSLYPSEVQGKTAATQLIDAIETVIHEQKADCIILSRGGGSLEDLFAFNDEKLARTIYACPIPIITGIGHETDFTIADFVADYRAATPTAAAEKASPNQFEYLDYLRQIEKRLISLVKQNLTSIQQKLKLLKNRFEYPEKILFTPWQRLDYLQRHLINVSTLSFRQKEQQLQAINAHLNLLNPRQQVNLKMANIDNLKQQLARQFKQALERKNLHFKALEQSLFNLGPQATLNRGYAIAKKNDHVLHQATEVNIDDDLHIILAHGHLKTKVTEVNHA